MQQPDSSWRHQYYTAILDKVLAVTIELKNCQTLEASCARQEPNITVHAVVSPRRLSSESLKLITATKGGNGLAGAQSTLNPASIGILSQAASGHSISTSPTSNFTASPTSPWESTFCRGTRESYSSTAPTTATPRSPISPPWSDVRNIPRESSDSTLTSFTACSPITPLRSVSEEGAHDSAGASSAGITLSPLGAISCPLCPKKFKPLFGLMNLQRHLKTAKIHNHGATFACPRPDCGARIARKDNLNKHLQTVHSEPALGCTQKRGTMKRRRNSDDTMEQVARACVLDSAGLQT